MKDTCFIVVSEYGIERMTKRAGGLKRGEVAVKLSLRVPDSCFVEPAISVDVDVPPSAVRHPAVVVEVEDAPVEVEDAPVEEQS